MTYQLFIALRYLRAKHKQAFTSVITVISIIGIAIGVMALVEAREPDVYRDSSNRLLCGYGRANHSEDDDRVDRTSEPSRNTHGCDTEQERRSTALGGLVSQFVQIKVVEQGHPHRDER